MVTDTDRLYEVMACAYRNGLLEKMLSIQGDSMKAFMRKRGLNLYHFINQLDEMEEEKLWKLDRLLQSSNFLFKLLSSDFFIKTISFLLDCRIIKKIVSWISELIYSWMLRSSRKAADVNG